MMPPSELPPLEAAAPRGAREREEEAKSAQERIREVDQLEQREPSRQTDIETHHFV